MVLAYPDIFTDALTKGRLEARRICRTFSDCTTAPRNGLISGCYPLDSLLFLETGVRAIETECSPVWLKCPATCAGIWLRHIVLAK